MPEISVLVGLTIKELTGVKGGDDVKITTTCGRSFIMNHHQDCCESVEVEDICGDINDIIGSPVTSAEEVTSEENPSDANAETIEYQESFTWTFYKIDTQKGGITIRWYGSSNGYYSESVDFEEIKSPLQ